MRAPVPPPDDDALDSALRDAARLVARASTHAVALADFGIELPPGTVVQADTAQLRAIAGLYLAAELEAAGVVPVVEALSALGANGRLPFNPGSAAEALAAYWRARRDRPSAEERAATFARLFGTGGGPASADAVGNPGFEADMIELTEALYKLDELGDNPNWGGVSQQARVRRAAERVAVGLLDASSGLTVFVAEELLTSLNGALGILRHPDLRAVLRARDLWSAVETAGRLVRHPFRPARLHAQRGRAGMTVIAWLADAAPHLNEAAPLLGLDHPVIPAAVEWLQAALEIGEARSAAPQRSPWAVLAG
ncbi:MAG: hypothetical protein AB7O44_29380 [Hyphomicrobiaceae bacterium]